jgi:hypothetical protein
MFSNGPAIINTSKILSNLILFWTEFGELWDENIIYFKEGLHFWIILSFIW